LTLKETRKQAGITQVEMAEKLGMTYASYNAKENGREYTSGGTVRRAYFTEPEREMICRILKCKKDVFKGE
jgi:transcriptional regulator with XRE-family HTH domain